VASQLLDVFGFLSVLLRGSALALNSLVWGGLLFTTWVLRPFPQGPRTEAVWSSCRTLITWSAFALVCVQAGFAAADSVILSGTSSLPFREIAGANFFVASMAAICAAAAIATFMMTTGRTGALLLIPAGVALSALVTMSHAAARLQYRPTLYALTAIHQAATASWVGGIPYLLLALGKSGSPRITQAICRRFSVLAIAGVGLLVASGVGMSLAYVKTPTALYGTAYGAMLVCKLVLFGFLLLLGGLNFLILRQHPALSAWMLPTLRRFAEAEVGIGFTVILAAASLTSTPPAVDLPQGRLSAPEIAQRMRPQWPLLETPPLSSLSPPSPLGFNEGEAKLVSFVPGATYKPNTPGDIAWSEYNHHWSGLIVMSAGLLALLARLGVRWARHWPLTFLCLAVFLFLRSDPENWPLGPRSFWQSFASAEVLQHRVFVVLIILFAGFEWGVRTGRIASQSARLVFPAVCAIGGALLLTHAHSLGNIKEELLAELSHIPLAIFGIAAGWSRWLELRLPGPQQRVLAWIWPVCFVLIGGVLLNYREG
jgi:copper resistance protein D